MAAVSKISSFCPCFRSDHEFGNGGRDILRSVPAERDPKDTDPDGYESILNFFKRGMGTITGSSLGMEPWPNPDPDQHLRGANSEARRLINAVSKIRHECFPRSAYLFERNSAMDARSFSILH